MSNEWWRGGVIYQIYPRSYLDSTGDGIGDLKGITSKLEHIARLGVEAIWISPFFTSPMKDFGYDVSDYTDIDPMFGTLADFDALIAKADSLNLKIIIDMVISHTSDQHEWFKESRSSKDNPKADWYVWADPKADGTPPNNWLSIFGGSAWEWDTGRRQYYMHNFLGCQPDLNFHNPDVVQAVKDACEFWLKRGVKGFRLDTSNFYYCDKELRNNPPNTGALPENVPESNPYALQEHIYDINQPENLTFLEEIRELMDKYPGTATVGELGRKDSLAYIQEYTEEGKRLNMVYTFHFLNETFNATFIRDTITYLEERLDDGWPCWALSNHDVPRAVTRWNKDNIDQDHFARFLLALLTSLRGTICMYQGEELALTEADIPFEKLQDPYGIRFWPEFKGRDGCRTPMVWEHDKAFGGFTPSSDEPWLPVPDNHAERAVDVQHADADSTMHHFASFLKWRKTHPALLKGSIEVMESPEDVLAFSRSHGDDTIICCFNCSTDEHNIDVGDVEALENHGFDHTLNGTTLTLPAYSVFFGRKK